MAKNLISFITYPPAVNDHSVDAIITKVERETVSQV